MLHAPQACVVLLLGLAAASTAAFGDEALRRSFVSGRSGHMVLSAAVNNADAVLVLPNDAKTTKTTKKVPLRSLAPLCRRRIGLQPTFADEDNQDASLMGRSAAAVFIAVEGVSSELVQQKQLLHLQTMMSEHRSVAVDEISQPRSMESMLATAVTAADPMHHGIVAKSWRNAKGERVEAFSSHAEGRSSVANTAELLHQAFADEPIIVSVSSSPQLCAAVSPRTASSSRIVTLCKSDDDAWRSVSIQFQKAGELFPVVGSVVKAIRFANRNFEVEFLDSTVSMNVENPAVFDLFAEALHAINIAKKCSSDDELNQAVHDAVPDFFSFVLVGAERIREAFGDESKEYHAALLITDSTIAAILSSISSLYSDRSIYSQVLLLPRSDASYLPPNTIAAMQKRFPDLDFEHAPMVYSSSQSKAERRLVELMKATLDANIPINVHDLADLSVTTATVSSSDIELYQVALWFSIAVVVLLFAAFYAFAYMENARDTLLYTKFTPAAAKKMR